VIAIVATSKDMDWIKAHLGTLTKLLESAVLSDFSPLHDTLRPILEKMFACLPAPSESGNVAETLSDDLTAFQNWAENIANSLNKPDKVLSAKDRLQGPLFVLQCYIKARPERLEASAAAVVKLITKLTLDLTGSNLPSNVYENAHRSAIAIMELCRGHLAQLKDQRRPYLGALHHLIEHCTSIPMCRYILDMLRDWTLIKQDPLPAYKEKAGLLNRMTTYESRRDEASGLYHDYLQLILDIFQEPSLARSDLTNRLEGAFLIGTRCSDPVLRSKFVAMLEKSLPTDIPGRLRFILATQNWEHVAGTYWMTLATDLLYGCIERSQPLVVTPPSISEGQGSVLDTHLDTRVLIRSFRALLPLDNALVDEVWADAFQSCWSTLDRPLQVDVQRWFTGLICKEHHMEQVEKRPNGIQTLFRGALACGRSFLIPPLVIKYFGKTFGAWHTAMELLSMGLEQTDAEDLRDGCADALTELYAELSEDDLFYGLWRRRCLHDETNAGLALEQNGLWPRAQEVYEQAQTKVRNGVIPYTENEYNVWQDHWIIAAQKLQQWDILTDLARHENNHDLLLECAWRLSDWGSQDREMIERTLDAVSDVPTPRRKVFQAYTCLIKAHTGHEDPSNFLRVLDEAIQLSMRKWCSLPTQLSAAHIPLLQMFQQYVELQEAAGVFESLSQTNRETLEARVTQDLKPIFQTWRERLPNFWDDISVWSDILAWRQHVFSAVTKVYSPLINANEPGTYGFRGFHETAWTINRFGHVARKHGLSDVCLSALGKIYALPNIEISEAFLKLREQALCLFQRPERFAEGLESISTTNLMYFANNQKAEFLTLKGMFVAKLGRENEANIAFAQAVQVDLNLPKAWAEWGRWNDRLFKERPVRAPEQPEPEPGKPRLSEMQWQANYAQERMGLAANAVSCYLQAAGLYKSAKARKLLVRVLWLLGVDDSASTVSRAFESYTGDVAIWYWITLIPQLLLSLTHREARHARNILMKIAKNFPQVS
jgi:transformation/transcription domain-associated protein